MRVKWPRTNHIGGNVLKTRIVPGLGAKTGDAGTCCLGTGFIEIDASMRPVQKTVTWLHERVEGINSVYLARTMSHDDIERMGEALLQVLQDLGIEIDWS